jgi:hypothetical protein
MRQAHIHTVTAGLHRCLDVADALDGHAILVISVHVLVLELTNLVDENTELVGDIGDIVVACLTPDRELLLSTNQYIIFQDPMCKLTATSMRSLETSSMLRMTFFSIFTS